MIVESTVLELDEDVDSCCCVEDVLVLELDEDVDSCCCVEDVLVLELAVLDPTVELVLPSNSVSMVIEKSAATTITATIVDRLLVRLNMTCLSLTSFSKVLQRTAKRVSFGLIHQIGGLRPRRVEHNSGAEDLRPWLWDSNPDSPLLSKPPVREPNVWPYILSRGFLLISVFMLHAKQRPRLYFYLKRSRVWVGTAFGSLP
jgi:hypothetical protein